MNLKRSLAIPAAALAIIASGLTLGACLPEGVGATTPTTTQTIPPVLTVALEEDDPGWNCETQGNRICGNMPEPMRQAAWQAFDAAGGADYLLVDTHARVTLMGYTSTDPYLHGAPDLDVHQLAIHESGVWYVFTAQAV